MRAHLRLAGGGMTGRAGCAYKNIKTCQDCMPMIQSSCAFTFIRLCGNSVRKEGRKAAINKRYMLTDLQQLDAGERILFISKSYSSSGALINPMHVSLTTKTTVHMRLGG